ncbi:unnamed protein product [Calicophoron daubneyi]|uniref:Fibronectin type-III domain-containing protein n=1 Tax=Calicophoron daubneyi TaxID=300641 RepID=A0AAV2T7C2_CALDB
MVGQYLTIIHLFLWSLITAVQGVPSAVSNLTIISETNGTLVRWDQSTEHIQEYELIYFDNYVNESYTIQPHENFFRILRPECTDFVVIIRAKNESGPISVKMGSVSPAVPSPPEKLQVFIDGDTGWQMISWDPPNNYSTCCFLNYELQFREEGGHWNVLITDENAYNLTDFKWNTCYKYRVRSLSGKERISSKFTEEQELCTPHGPYVKVRSLGVTAANDSALTTWEAPAEKFLNPSGYQLTIVGGGIQESFNISGSRTWHNFTGLSPCTYYTFMVAVGSGKFVAHPVSKMAKTDPQDVPSKPNLPTVNTTCGSIRITWPSVSYYRSIISHQVQVTSTKDGTQVEKQASGDHDNINITGLVCDQSYIVTMETRNACGPSTHSDPLETIACDRVPAWQPAIQNVLPTHNSITIIWGENQPTRVGLVYRVTLTEMSTHGAKSSEDRYTTSSSITFNRLPSCTTFNWTLTAHNQFGPAVPVTNVTETEPPVPETPSDVIITQINRTTQQVNWTRPADFPTACSLDYRVSATDAAGQWNASFITNDTFLTLDHLNYSTLYAYYVVAVAKYESTATQEVALLSPPGKPFSLWAN